MGLRAIGLFFFFNDTATTEIYTLSLHDALPISEPPDGVRSCCSRGRTLPRCPSMAPKACGVRSEEHTSELQSQSNLVCRLLLEKKYTCQALLRSDPREKPCTVFPRHLSPVLHS